MRRGTHAFWALHDEPVSADGHREALVLIRANHTSDVVYAVSFVDLESAWSFARFEAKRGLDVSHLIILWAAFATVREELDGVTILPAAAPETRTQQAGATARQTAVEQEATEAVREYERREGPPVSDGAAVLEAPADEGIRRAEAARQAAAEAEAARRAEAVRQAEAEAEAARRAEAARQAEAKAEAARRAEAVRQAEAEEAARLARQAQERLRAARAAADAVRAAAKAESTRRQEIEHQLEEQRQAAETAARARALADMASGIESALSLPEAAVEEPLILDATSVALEGFAEARAQPLPEDPSLTIGAPTDATSDAGDDTTLTGSALDAGEEAIASGTVFAHAPAVEAEDLGHPDGPDADDTPRSPELDEFDIAYEVARLLENRRWSRREEPFQGFESPPGRF
jgi:hypothetical protein